MKKWMVLVITVAAGCGTTQSLAPGPSVTRVEQELQVCLDSGRMTAGEQVQFVRRSCRPINAKNTTLVCSESSVETGEVVRNIDDRCSLVRVNRGGELRPGDQLQLASR
jgi:hypothetical protein